MRYESKISNNKLQIPKLCFWWEGKRILSICILCLILFITPVNAQIENGMFYYNNSGWTIQTGGTGSVSASVTWQEINATTHQGQNYFYTSSAFTGPVYARLYQNVNVTGMNEITYTGIAGYWFSNTGGSGGGDSFKMTIGGLTHTVPSSPTSGTYTLNVSSLSGVQQLIFELYTVNTGSGSILGQYTIKDVKSDLGTDILSSINFNPNVESTENNDLYFDYNVGTNYTDDNTFVYSFYEPNFVNISSFEGYTEDSGENIPMSTAYLGGNYSINLYRGPFGPASLQDATLLASDTIYVNSTNVELLEYTQDTYIEYDDTVVNYNITSYKVQYPSDTFYLTMLVPYSTREPYYFTEIFELTENVGSRSSRTGAASPIAYPNYQNATAWITKYNATEPYVNIGNAVYAEILDYNHTLIEFRGFDWQINKSYVTGGYVGVNIDIKDYIETDYLGYPEESFKIWLYAYSNSNEGNVYTFQTLDSGYWAKNAPYTYHFSYDPYIGRNFNATLESYITVYRNGTTTQLTPTVYSNMYAENYIPEGEAGYIPPEIPEEPEDPQIPNGTELPDNPEIPIIPDNQTGIINQSINLTWIDTYYTFTNSTLDSLFSPIQNFTIYAVTPVTLLNDSISSFNYEMNISFTETNQKMQIMTESFNIIVSSIHPKVVNVITYYLMWLILLIILRKR